MSSVEMNSAVQTDLMAKLENQFMYHIAEGAQPLKFATIRGECLELAQLLVALCPVCEERDEAIRKLNEVMFWANAAVARHDGSHP
jgi:hypothetical protein